MSHPFPVRTPRGRPLALLLCCLLLSGCGVLGRRRAPVDLSQDPRIRREVEQRLASEPALREGNLRVEVTGGVVTLHGNVHGIGAWQCALTTASLVRGVRTVADYLVIERGPRDVRCLAPRPDTASIAAGW
jgi:hypothetical protein